MEFFFIGKIFCGCEGQTRSDDTFDSGVVSQVKEKYDTLHRTILFEVSFEETGDLHVDSHCCEHHTEVFLTVISHVLALDQGCLTHDLGTDFVVGQTVCRKQRDLLTSGDGSHDVNSRDTGLEHLFGVDSLARVNGLTLDVEELFSKDWWSLVDRGT